MAEKCNHCVSTKDKDAQLMIPYILYESSQERNEKEKRRWFITTLIVIILLVATNLGWFIYESQFEEVSYEQKVDQDTVSGYNHFIGGDSYGSSDN